VGTGIEEFQRAGASENKNNGQIIQKYDLKPIYFRNKNMPWQTGAVRNIILIIKNR
jgi:hypothetical protein